MRRISTGQVGRSILGDFFVTDNSLQSIGTNNNIVFDPDGTGEVRSNAPIQLNAQNSLRLGDGDSAEYVGLGAPSSVTTSYTLTLPATDGSSGNVLITNGSGTLSWSDPNIDVANETASSSTYYPALTTSTSGTITGVNVSSSKLSFTPNNGRLTTTQFVCNSVDIGGGAIDGTAIGASTASTGRFSSITETSSITLKENINPITNALDSILCLSGVTYDRKDGTSTTEPGLIAEEVDKILPNLVTKSEDGKPESIMYTKLTAYLIEAIKTLKEEVEFLKGKR